MLQEENILSAVTETLTDKPRYKITIPVTWFPDLPKQTIWDKILRRPLPREPEKERTFVIYPCKVCNMYRIAGVASRLPNEIKGGTQSEVYLPLINEYIDDVVYVIAAGIQNNHLEPDPELIQFIERNFDGIDLYNCLQPVLENVNMESFFNSIVLIKGTVKILQPKEEKTSPRDGSELIASHTAQ